MKSSKIKSPAFPIVCLGASAGGLAAFEAFFMGMAAYSSPGMAFILVQHLSPDHKSMLAEIIRRFTKMEVFEIEDGMPVKLDCIYIIPPERDLFLTMGILRLTEPLTNRHKRLPIDFFFRSLAEDQGKNAVGIILSGTGSDGTQGLRIIKGEGGMVIAQSPDSAEYDGMPSSAIATGMVDFILPPADMPAKIHAYVNSAIKTLSLVQDEPNELSDIIFQEIFALLRAHTGHDFSQYKPGTISRRIERRMAVHQISSLEIYVKHLQRDKGEISLLFRDLLIGVTSFFRDPEFFDQLSRKAIPGLFAEKPFGSMIRVWVPGCSTGEEAYSVAILLQEYMDASKLNFNLQVFATDIDSHVIAVARSGTYPSNIVADVSPERLKRFFVPSHDNGTYRICKAIRDLLIFSEQDLVKDPPFSKLDLISCRNLLIYMSSELQKKLIPLFHYALNPDGILFLGSSETIGEFGEIFVSIDRKAKLYQRKEDFKGISRITSIRFQPNHILKNITAMPTNRKQAVQKKVPLREFAEQALLQHVDTTGILVDKRGDIIYLHGHTSKFLELSPGESGINNILKMALPGLRNELSIALHKAAVTNETVKNNGIRINSGDSSILINLKISPVLNPESSEKVKSLPQPTESHLYLVLLEESSDFNAIVGDQQVITQNLPADADAHINALKEELRAKKEYLQSTNEELETSNEELKSSYEEMQSINEELQSTNEELETSKEELQSINEELSTVNAELQNKVSELSQSNNDMNNLLAGTGIGTVFIDQHLRILRYTPAVTHIINLIPGDIGRPIAHVVSNLTGYHDMAKDAEAVLETLVSKEVEVQTSGGTWYIMRILPYRTLENVIEGAVITFVEITEIKRASEKQLESDTDLRRLGAIIKDANDALMVFDLSGRIMAWNPAAIRIYGWSEQEALLLNLTDLSPMDTREKEIKRLKHLTLARFPETYKTERLTKDGRILKIATTSTALLDKNGLVYAIATTERPENI